MKHNKVSEGHSGPVFSTTEAAQFFERSTQWVYWGLRNKVFCDNDGHPISPERAGNGAITRRRFTTAQLRAIHASVNRRRDTFSRQELERAMHRIRITERGQDWRQQEGWRLISGKWIHPDKCQLVAGKWVRTPAGRATA